MNPAAQAILGIPVKKAVGLPISHLISGYAHTERDYQSAEDDQVEISLGSGSKARDYILFPTTLRIGGG